MNRFSRNKIARGIFLGSLSIAACVTTTEATAQFHQRCVIEPLAPVHAKSPGPLPEKDTTASEEEELHGIVMTEGVSDYMGWARTTDGRCVPTGRPASRDSVMNPMPDEANVDVAGLQPDNAERVVEPEELADIKWIPLNSERLEEPTGEGKVDLCPSCCRWIDIRLPKITGKETSIDPDIAIDVETIEGIPVTPAEIVNESVLNDGFSDLPADSPWLELMTGYCRHIETYILNGMTVEKSPPAEGASEAGIR